MVSPVTLNDLGQFLQNVLLAFDDFIIYSFVLMVTLYFAMGVRRLFIGIKQ